MKHATTILPLILLLTACSRRATTLDQQIAGTWTQYGTRWTNTTDYVPDGSFSVITRKSSDSHSSAGTWKLEDRVLIVTFTNASNVSHPLDVVARYRIIHVDDHQFIYEQSGQTNKLIR